MPAQVRIAVMVWPISSCNSRATSRRTLSSVSADAPPERQLRASSAEGLVQLAQAQHARAEQLASEALSQQREQQIYRVIVPGLAGNQRDGVHQRGDQYFPAVMPGKGDDRQRQTKRREA